MIVRSRLPWPLRWAAAALVLGFSAAIALWAFEFGRGIAGLDGHSREELERLRAEVVRLRADNDRAVSVANTAESLLRAERAAQEQLAQTVRQLERESQQLKADLGFFERLLPASGQGLMVRGLQAERQAPGQLRWQVLVMQAGREVPEFSGWVEVLAMGQFNGRPWAQTMAGGPRQMKIRRYARLEGLIDHPPEVQLKAVQVRVTDDSGVLRISQSAPL